jgi:hypothetical protein
VNDRKHSAAIAVIAALAAALTVSVTPLASAQTSSTATGNSSSSDFFSGVRYEVTPYLWIAGVSGRTRLSGRVPLNNEDALFEDILDSLSGGFMGTFEARKDRWGFVFDLVYIQLSKQSRPILDGRLGTVSAKLDEALYQFAGAYRVSDDPAVAVDILLGVRHPSSDLDLTYSPSQLLPSGVSRSGDKGWTDGFVGVRVGYKLTDKWTLIGYADIGTGGSEKSWQLIAGATYKFNDTVSGKFGYRIIASDFDEQDFVHNIKLGGVYGGLGFSF